MGVSQKPIVIPPEEVGIFWKNEHDEIVKLIIELTRARTIAVQMIGKYSELRSELDELFVEVGQFEYTGDQIHLASGFKPAERPDIVGKIHKSNDVLGQLHRMTSDCEKIGEKLISRINEVLPVYFPKGTRLRKLHVVSRKNGH